MTEILGCGYQHAQPYTGGAHPGLRQAPRGITQPGVRALRNEAPDHHAPDVPAPPAEAHRLVRRLRVPQDEDAYLRPSLSYAWSDALTVAERANVLVGADATFFGQLESGSNAYLRVRYSF